MEDEEWNFPRVAHFSIFRLPSSILRFSLLLALAFFVAGCSPSGPRALLNGKKMLERGDYAAAVAQLKTATTLLATNAQAWNYYGVACQHAGQFADAAQAYQNALKLDRDLTEAHYNLGCLWLEQDKPDAARTEFTAYTLRRGNVLEGWLKLGIAQLRAGDYLSAERSFSTAYSINTNNAEALNGIGLARVQRGKPREAAQYFAAAHPVSSRLRARAAEPGDGRAPVFARRRGGAGQLPEVSRAHAASGGLGRSQYAGSKSCAAGPVRLGESAAGHSNSGSRS